MNSRDTNSKIRTVKPKCKLCTTNNLNICLARELLYSVFNPYHLRKGKLDVSQLIKKHIDDPELKRNYELISYLLNDMMDNFAYINLPHKKLEEHRAAKQKAWREIKDKIDAGELSMDDVSASDLVYHFYQETLQDLIQDGYISSVVEGLNRHIHYTSQAEKILGEKVLKISIQELEKHWQGEHETSQKGMSIFTGNTLEEYDPFLHSFDMIDVQETMINSALKDPQIELKEENIVIRELKHTERCVYVFLIDASDSMRGQKILGAVEATLALRRAIESSSDDVLYTVSFNHTTRRLREGEIINVNVKGRTDIGLALRTARKILRKEKGTGIVFLITDGEPTSTSLEDTTPWSASLIEAQKLNSVDARLSIMMFGRERRFVELCNKIASKCQNSHIVFFEDPLNLKNYVIHSFINNHLR
ncbi:MAG: VWA domain-containing protein [Candidatus Hadarchaeota archaeon]